MFNKKVVKGSFILLIAFGLFNLFNFIYQFAMARFLSVEEYGILATLFAIIYIFSIFSESIQTIIAKYSANSENQGQLKNLLKKSLKRGIRISAKIFIFYILVSFILSYFFKISYSLLLINGLILCFMFLLPITRGIIQGRGQFISLGSNLVMESLSKLVLAMIFVVIGMKVYGAIVGFVLGTSIAFLLSLVSLRKVIRSKEEKSKNDGIYSYARPTFFITSIIVLFYSVDILIARILFSEEIVGTYAIASILGKIIFWISIPVGKAMFPLSIESENNKEPSKKILGTSLLVLGLIIFGVLATFYFASDYIIYVFSGKSIPLASNILIYLGIAFSLIAISNILLLYQLSINKIKKYKLIFLCNIIEIILLLTLSNNILTFSIIFMVSSVLLLIGSILIFKLNRHV